MKPKLRFQGFHDDWEEKKLGEVADIRDGVHSTPTYLNEGIPFYSVENIKYLKTEKYISKDEYQRCFKNNIVEKNDIFMTRIGSIGESNIVNFDGPIAYYVSLALIKPYQQLNSFFMNQYIKSNNIQKELWNKTLHVAFPKKINKNDIGTIQCRLPSLPEQEKIGAFLSQLDDRIKKQEQKIELLKERKKGWMQQLFSQTIRFKDENGQDYPAWEEKKLGDIGYFIKGKGLSKKDIVDDGKYSCILYGELYTKYREVINYVYSKSNYCSNVEVSSGNEVLIPSSGESNEEIAQASYLPYKNILLGGDINIFRSLENGIYISYFLNKNAKRLSVIAQGATVVHLYASALEKVKISLPSLPEQEKIAEFLSKQDELIEKEEEKLSLLKAQKKGLLQQMFV